MANSTLYLGWQLFVRDFHARYRRTGLAFVWILSPVLAITAMSSLIAQTVDATDTLMTPVPYPLFAATGLVLWGLFSETVTGPQQMCRRARAILKRAPFPPAALLIANLCYVGMNFIIKLVPLAALFIFYGVALAADAWLALPFIVGLLAFGSALGALIAPLSMIYQDVRHGLGFIVGGLLLATPVLYQVPAQGIRHLAATVNPIAWLLLPARDYILSGAHQPLFTGSDWLFLAASLAFLPLALLYYRLAIRIGIAHL